MRLGLGDQLIDRLAGRIDRKPRRQRLRRQVRRPERAIASSPAAPAAQPRSQPLLPDGLTPPAGCAFSPAISGYSARSRRALRPRPISRAQHAVSSEAGRGRLGRARRRSRSGERRAIGSNTNRIAPMVSSGAVAEQHTGNIPARPPCQQPDTRPIDCAGRGLLLRCGSLRASSGQRRPASVAVAAGGSARDLRLAVLDDRLRVLPAILRADPIGLSGDRLAVSGGIIAFPGNCLAGLRIFQRAVLGFDAWFFSLSLRPLPIEPPTSPPRIDLMIAVWPPSGGGVEVSPETPWSFGGSLVVPHAASASSAAISAARVAILITDLFSGPTTAAAISYHLWLNLGFRASVCFVAATGSPTRSCAAARPRGVRQGSNVPAQACRHIR